MRKDLVERVLPKYRQDAADEADEMAADFERKAKAGHWIFRRWYAKHVRELREEAEWFRSQ